MNENWRNHIVCNPDILVGKPTIKGTRISVELILRYLASGWTREQIFESYPRVTDVDLNAALEFAAEAVGIKKTWELIDLKSG